RSLQASLGSGLSQFKPFRAGAALDDRQAPAAGDVAEGRRLEHAAYGRRLVMAVLQQQPPSVREVGRRLRDNLPYRVEPARAGNQRRPRLVAQGGKVHVAFGDVRRIRSDQVEAPLRTVEP